MSSPSSVPEPMHQCALVHHLTSSQPTFSGVTSIGCNQSSAQIPPGRLMTTSAAMSAQINVLVTIPIDNRRCFTQRFSPTGFILNAPDSNCSRPIARLAFKIKPVQSIQSWQAAGYLITASARASTFGGIVRPICLRPPR
jgi:hypothetical protein